MEEKNYNKFDILVSKYISIWLWSIIFGINVTIAYRLIGDVSYSGRQGILGLPMLLLDLIALIIIAISWKNLYLYLNEYIIPRIFPTSDKEINILELNEKAIYLKKAFSYLLTATILMFITEFYSFIINAFEAYSNNSNGFN